MGCSAWGVILTPWRTQCAFGRSKSRIAVYDANKSVTLSNGMETTYVGSNSVVPNDNSSRFPLKPDLRVRAFLDMVIQEV